MFKNLTQGKWTSNETRVLPILWCHFYGLLEYSPCRVEVTLYCFFFYNNLKLQKLRNCARTWQCKLRNFVHFLLEAATFVSKFCLKCPNWHFTKSKNMQRKKTKSKLQWTKCLFFQHLYMNAKMTKIVILGPNAKKENVFVKEIQQEMGNTAEVIITHATYVTARNRLKELINLFSFIFHDYIPFRITYSQ